MFTYKLYLNFLKLFPNTDNNDVILFWLSNFYYAKNVSFSEQQFIGEKTDECWLLVEPDCQSSKPVRHFRCQVAL